MKKSRYSEEQIIGILKQHEAGVKTADLRREHGISEATFYNWKSKYGGLGVSEFFPAFDCRPVRPSILEPAVLCRLVPACVTPAFGCSSFGLAAHTSLPGPQLLTIG